MTVTRSQSCACGWKTCPWPSQSTLKEAAAKDQDYQELVERVKTGQVPAQDSQLYQYHKVWPELSILDGLVMKGDKIVIPQTDLGGEEGDFRHWVVELAHEGHVGGLATKTDCLTPESGPVALAGKGEEVTQEVTQIRQRKEKKK